MTRKERIAKRNAFLDEQQKLYLEAKRNPVPVEYAVAQKVDGRWRWAFRTKHEACRDTVLHILMTDKRFPVRRVNL